MANSDIQQIPGVYHRRIGDIVVTAIADGFLDGDVDPRRVVDPRLRAGRWWGVLGSFFGLITYLAEEVAVALT